MNALNQNQVKELAGKSVKIVLINNVEVLAVFNTFCPVEECVMTDNDIFHIEDIKTLDKAG